MVWVLTHNYLHSIAVDLLHHCNGCCSAHDVASHDMNSETMVNIIRGVAEACRHHGVDVIGGDTAEIQHM